MTTTTLNGRDLRNLMDADKAARRYEAKGRRGRRMRPQQSKRQRDAWRNETWA